MILHFCSKSVNMAGRNAQRRHLVIVSLLIFLLRGALLLVPCARVAWACAFPYARHGRRQARVSACPSPPAGNLVLIHRDHAVLGRDFTWLRRTPAILCCPLCGEQCESEFDQYQLHEEGLLVGLLSHRCGAPEIDEYVVCGGSEVADG